jgi:hypothetical protein
MLRIFETEKILNKEDFFVFLPKNYRAMPIKPELNIHLKDLHQISEQKEIILKNTLSFINNQPSNNTLLWGAKGMGKSTLVKCVIKHLNNDLKKKLKLVEVLNNNLGNLADITYELSQLKHKFIVFVDDISFENNNHNFRFFKSLIEGSLLSNIKNIRYYITSNLRHLSHDNSINSNANEIQIKEATQNLISLSDRFGCWIGFYDCNQEEYLKITKHYLKKAKISLSALIEKLALQWSIEKGNFSGRTAFQFVNNLIVRKI